MSSSTYNSVSSAFTTGTIIAIAVGSAIGITVLITVIIVIVCIIKQSNRRKAMITQGIILGQAPPYSYSNSWSNQYPPNYPSPYQPTAPPYITPTPNYT